MTRNVYVLRPRISADDAEGAITVGMLRTMVGNLDGCPDGAVVRVLPTTRWWRRKTDPDGPVARQMVVKWTV